MILVGFAAKYLQMFRHRGFNFGVARQRAATIHAESFGRFLLCDTIVPHAVIDDNASCFLRHDLTCALRFTTAFSGHVSLEERFVRFFLVAFLIGHRVDSGGIIERVRDSLKPFAIRYISLPEHFPN